MSEHSISETTRLSKLLPLRALDLIAEPARQAFASLVAPQHRDDLHQFIEQGAQSLHAAVTIMDGTPAMWADATEGTRRKFREKFIRAVAAEDPSLSKQAERRTAHWMIERSEFGLLPIPELRRLTETIQDTPSEFGYQLEKAFKSSPWGTR